MKHIMIMTIFLNFQVDLILIFFRGDFGRLGHGNSSDLFIPQPIRALQGLRIKQIACGDSHCLAVTMEGEVQRFVVLDRIFICLRSYFFLSITTIPASVKFFFLLFVLSWSAYIKTAKFHHLSFKLFNCNKIFLSFFRTT